MKNSLLWVFLIFSFLFSSQPWVAKFENRVWYEKDFYRFFPKNEWSQIEGLDKKTKIFNAFLKQNVAVSQAVFLGLQHNRSVDKKLTARHNMLMVNEYYMRYFLSSLIPPSALFFCGQNLKREVFTKHILLKHKKDQEVLQKAKNIKDSILFGSNFKTLALNFSEDPGVGQNKGALGWLSIGKTVPEFQSAVFNLCLGCVDVVETEFGFHVIQVDSIRSSMYNSLDKEEYDDYVFRFSSAYIEGSLKDLAAEHDSLLVKSAGIFFNDMVLHEIVSALDVSLKFKNGNRKDVDVLKILKETSGVVVEYNSSFLSASWFAHKLETSLQRSVFYGSFEEIKKDFLTILLRDIVYKKGLVLGLNNSFSFLSQYNPIRLGVLEKSFLKNLVSSVKKPTRQEVEFYFLSNKNQQDLDVAYKSIEAVLLQKKQKQAKESFLLSVEKRKNITINEEWFNE